MPLQLTGAACPQTFCQRIARHDKPNDMPTVDPSSIPTGWLVEKLKSKSFEDVLRHDFERAQLVDVDIDAIIRDAKTKGQHKWNDFASGMLESDELWFFSNSEAEWANLAGRSGYAFVRDGRIVAAQITSMS